MDRYYLDHAATSWPKPPGSMEACIEYQQNNGATSGRGVYQSADRASKLIMDARRMVADYIHAPSANEIAFCSNGTHALNAAIFGLLYSKRFHGSHVVTTSTEHNSVLRPLELAVSRCGIRWTAVPCDREGVVSPERIADSVEPDTSMIILNHASNVTGAVQDLAAISEIARKQGAVLVLDAAQTLGYCPIDVVRDHIDVLAAPGHKGAGGMLGTGLLFVRTELQSLMEPLWIGGTGTASDEVAGPFGWQSAVESGNVNVPAIASLKSGLQWLTQQVADDRLGEWTRSIVDAIRSQPNLQLIGPLERRLPVVSLISQSMSCHEMAMLLDCAMRIEARSGFHCAGLIHRDLGTLSQGGTLRLSLGHTSTQADVDAALQGIELLGSM